MNRDFLSNFERPDIAKDGQAQHVTGAVQDDTAFNDTDYVRNVCFVWPDGRRKFLNYARLDSGEMSSDHDTIRLVFGAETIEISGINLLPLFESFMEHQQKLVYCDDARYNDLNGDGPIVNEVNIFTGA